RCDCRRIGITWGQREAILYVARPCGNARHWCSGHVCRACCAAGRILGPLLLRPVWDRLLYGRSRWPGSALAAGPSRERHDARWFGAASIHNGLIICQPVTRVLFIRWHETELIRRRDFNHDQESWLIYFGDVQIGSIGLRAGVPHDAPSWG